MLLNRARGNAILHDFDRVGIFVLTSAGVLGWTMALHRPTVIGIVLLVCGTAGVVGWISVREAATITDAFQFIISLIGRTIRLRPKQNSQA